jgi:hypothetical protein
MRRGRICRWRRSGRADGDECRAFPAGVFRLGRGQPEAVSAVSGAGSRQGVAARADDGAGRGAGGGPVGGGRLHDLFLRWEAMAPGDYARGGRGAGDPLGRVATPLARRWRWRPTGACAPLGFVAEVGRADARWPICAGAGRGDLCRGCRAPSQSAGGRCLCRAGAAAPDRARRSRSRSGRRCCRCRRAMSPPIPNWRAPWATRARCAPWARPWGATRSACSSRATGRCGCRGAWAAITGDCRSSAPFWPGRPRAPMWPPERPVQGPWRGW